MYAASLHAHVPHLAFVILAAAAEVAGGNWAWYPMLCLQRQSRHHRDCRAGKLSHGLPVLPYSSCSLFCPACARPHCFLQNLLLLCACRATSPGCPSTDTLTCSSCRQYKQVPSLPTQLLRFQAMASSWQSAVARLTSSCLCGSGAQ
jgi:hypothetical protein